MKTVHIIWGDSASGSLKQALANANRPDEVLSFFDDLSVGPLFSENSIAGLQARNQYINWPDDEYLQGMVDFFDYDFGAVEKVVIWHADNASDKLMLYLLCSMLSAQRFAGQLSHIHTSGFGGVTPRFSFGMLSPIQLQSCFAEATPLALAQVQSYAELWQSWKTSDSMLRIFNDDAVIAVAEDFYDELLLSCCRDTFRPCARVIGEGMGHSTFLVGDGYLFNRIRCLITAGKLEADNDNLSAMRHFSIRLAQ